MINLNPPVNLSTQPSKLEGLDEKQVKQMELKKLESVAQDMEAEFFKLMVKEMDKTLSHQSLGVEATGHSTMREYMIERVSEDLSRKQPLGLAEQIISQYKESMEKTISYEEYKANQHKDSLSE